jgi:hypothetical protein
MNLIDRYVNEVGRRLPRKKRDDLKLELRSTLQDSLEDRYGDQPTDAEVEELLREFGSPEKVAASYQQTGQYLIGPEMFPFFRLVLGAVLLAVTIGLGVAFFMGAVFADPNESEIGREIAKYLGNFIQALFAAAGSVVVVFYILQRLGIQPNLGEDEDWNPGQLPDVEDYDLAGRGESIAGVAFSVVFLVLLNLFADKIGIVISWGDEPMLNNVVQDNLRLLNIAIILGIILNAVLLWQGRWNIFTRITKLATDILWLAIVIRLVGGLKDGEQVLLDAGLADPLPNLFVLFGYFVIFGVAISIVVNVVKFILHYLQDPTKGIQLKFS